MTINNAQEFVNGLWDWGLLKGCFGDTAIKPTDIDGFVERNGLFLVLETKQPGAAIPKGQAFMFEAMRRTGLFTIFIIWGKTNTPEQIQIITRRGAQPVRCCNGFDLIAHTTAWFKYAESSNGHGEVR